MKTPYIIDKLENLARYADLGPNFPQAIAFLQKADFATLPLGKTLIDGDNAYVSKAVADLKPLAEKKPELHHAYFDIQIPLDGEETYGLAAYDPSAPGSFDEAKDIGFYDQRVEAVTLKVGEFAIFAPMTCLHAPGCTTNGPRTITKLVVKVKG